MASAGTYGVAALALVLAACAPPAPAVITPMRIPSSNGGDAATSASASRAPKAFLVREPSGHLAIVEATTADSAALRGAVVSSLEASALAKLGNASMVLTHLERAKNGAPSSFYTRLDGTSAPQGETARREGLRAAGAEPQTVAGEVATVLVTAEKLGALLALPWVLGLETPGIVVPR